MKKKFCFLLTVTVPFLLCLFFSCSNYFYDLKNSVNDIEVSFKVEHWLQAVDENEYEHAEDEDQILTGLSLSKTNVEAKSFQGFYAKPIEQEKIKRDQSTVVKVYYDRNLISYTFDCDGGEWSDNDQTKIISGRYGTNVTRPEDPGKTGYVFNKWESGVPETFGIDDLTFYAKWLPDSGTIYKVERWLQNIDDDDYTLAVNATENYTGETDSMTEVTPATVDGFNDGVVTNLPIAPDGSTVVKVYYDRKIITYTFKSGDGKWGQSTADVIKTGRYGAAVTKPEDPISLYYPAYLFYSWGTTVPSTFGATDKTFTARYDYNLYETPVALPSGTNGTAGTNWTYVYFGVYPQTIMPSNVTITNQTKTIGGRTCYLGSDKMYYYKCKENGYPDTEKDENDNEYRVYYYYSDGSLVKTSDADSYRYFRMEPIKWRVVTNSYNNTGKALLLAEDALDGGRKFADHTTVPYNRTEMYSFLNTAFMNAAFTTKARNLIESTYVINSEEHTYPKIANDGWKHYHSQTWSYAYEKIFLLSVRETTDPDFGFSSDPFIEDKAGIRISTDYTKANYTWNSTDPGWGSMWWTRSLGGVGSKDLIMYVNGAGYFRRIRLINLVLVDGYICRAFTLTIVPALCVDPSVIK